MELFDGFQSLGQDNTLAVAGRALAVISAESASSLPTLCSSLVLQTSSLSSFLHFLAACLEEDLHG